jgi:ABC-type lipoprotein release transport system permease subunit
MIFSIISIHMTIGIALRKARKEKLWSVAMVGLLTIGLTTWMVVPSLSTSLQEGFSSYANNVATYMFVYNMGEDSYQSRIPAQTTNKIQSLEGVQEVYPVVNNFTYFIDAFTFHLPGNRTGVIGRMSNPSAVIGGKNGFPEKLISLSAGRLPEDRAEFLINGLAASAFNMNQSYIVDFAEGSPKFNATGVGQMPFNPMFQQAAILWNSAFLQRQLGSQFYDQTFGGEGANMFIVKVEDIEKVEPVAHELQLIFADYGGYAVMYDPEMVKAQLSFQSGSSVLYSLIGVLSLFSAVSIIFLFSYVFSGRRRWEAGLLITQGWSWRKVTLLFFNYFLILGILAAALAIALSLLVSSQITFSFQVYSNTLVIPAVITPITIVTGVAISLVVSVLAAIFAVWRMRKMGLDTLLREF